MRTNFLALTVTLNSFGIETAASDSHAISGVDYLRREGELFLSRVDFWFASASSAERDALKLAIRAEISQSIEGEAAEIELHKLAQFMSERRRFVHIPVINLLLFEISTETSWNLTSLLEERDPRLSAIVKLGTRLGMSPQDMRAFPNRLYSLEFPAFQDHLAGIESRVSDYVANAPTHVSPPLGLYEELLPTGHPERLMGFLRELHGMFSQEGLRRLRAAVMTIDEPEFLEAIGLFADVVEYIVVSPHEYVERFSEQIESIKALVEESVTLESMSQSFKEAAQELYETLSGFREFGESMAGTRDAMVSEIYRSFPPDSESRIILMPKIIALIRMVCLLPPHSDKSRFVELVHAVAAVSVRIIGKRSLTILSDFLDKFTDSLRRSLRGGNSESLVIRTAFDVSLKLRIPSLREYPNLLPEFSENKIIAIRNLIGSFLWFDGPTDWFENPSLPEALASASVAKLKRAIAVTIEMHKRGFNLPERASLVKPGSWLVEFLKNPTPTPYGEFIENCLSPNPFPRGEWTLLNRLPEQMENAVSRMFDFPERFARMADNAARLALTFSPEIPEYTLLNTALYLPRELLKIEINLHMLHRASTWPIVSLLERSVESYLDLVKAFAEIPVEDLIASNRESARICAKSFARVGNLFKTGNVALDENIDQRLIDALNLFIHEIRLLTDAVREDSVVPFVVNPADEREFCEFPHYDPPAF